MYLKPRGNWILVEMRKSASTEQETVVLLPEDYKKPDNPYSVVKVAEDSSLIEWSYGDMLLVPTHIIREIIIDDQTFLMIEKNHIMAKVEQ
jgi:co-chaperonin GroES (HSP10)